VRPEQARVRRLLAGLPLHADGALSGFLDRFEALLPTARLNLILGGEDLGPARRGLIEGCQDVARCPWRDSALTTRLRPVALAGNGAYIACCVLAAQRRFEQRGVVARYPEPAGASWRQLLEEAAQAVGVTVRLRCYSVSNSANRRRRGTAPWPVSCTTRWRSSWVTCRIRRVAAVAVGEPAQAFAAAGCAAA
jgi:two-component system nitrate/nitrite sensor histidine kinase NarX